MTVLISRNALSFVQNKKSVDHDSLVRSYITQINTRDQYCLESRKKVSQLFGGIARVNDVHNVTMKLAYRGGKHIMGGSKIFSGAGLRTTQGAVQYERKILVSKANCLKKHLLPRLHPRGSFVKLYLQYR